MSALTEDEREFFRKAGISVQRMEKWLSWRLSESEQTADKWHAVAMQMRSRNSIHAALLDRAEKAEAELAELRRSIAFVPLVRPEPTS